MSKHETQPPADAQWNQLRRGPILTIGTLLVLLGGGGGSMLQAYAGGMAPAEVRQMIREHAEEEEKRDRDSAQSREKLEMAIEDLKDAVVELRLEMVQIKALRCQDCPHQP